ncbi:MAG TPA: hypothetical protein VLQ45_05265, partial [Thermoanaerobaculia bacterium]|nr:hypothetical protein [Thermoanaerobaculia bacterium]
CLDQIRSQCKWQWTELEAVDPGDGPTIQPPTLASRGEDKDLLLRVLDRVPQECRERWRMIVAGLSYREMSLRMSVAEGTLRVRVLRCREKAVALRQELLTGTGGGRNKTVKSSPDRS